MSAAYREAYNTENMKPESVNREAHELRHTPKIAQRIEALEAERLERHRITADRVLNELAKIAFLDIRRAFDAAGNLLPLCDMDNDISAAIAGLEFEERFEKEGRKSVHVGRVHKIKLTDKKAALELLGRNLKLWTDKSELSGPGGGPIPTVNLNTENVTAQQAVDAYMQLVKSTQ